MGYRDYKTGIAGTCLGCEDRHPACHDSCEKYREARDEWVNKVKKIKEAKKKAKLFDTYKVEKAIKERKK